MDQKKLNKYLEYMLSLSDEDRERFYAPIPGQFTPKQVIDKIRQPLKKVDKSPYRNIELTGWWNDVFAPQATITPLTDNNTIKLSCGATLKRVKRKK